MNDPDAFTFTVDDHGTSWEVTIDSEMRCLLDGTLPFIQSGVVMLEKCVALHRAIWGKQHGLELSSVPPLIRINGEKLDCRISNLAPKPPKQTPPNLVFVPNDEMRSLVTEYGFVLYPLLIPAKYVEEARKIGIRRSPDKHARKCRVCQKQITTKEDFLFVLIQRRENSAPTKGYMHAYECVAVGQEVADSLSMPECWKRSQVQALLYPELYQQHELDHEEYGYQDDGEDYDDGKAEHEDDDAVAPLPVMVYVNSSMKKPCPFCDGAPLEFEQTCNHLIIVHGLICVHVGSESQSGEHTDACTQSTVAVFSRTPIPAQGNGAR